MGWLARLFGMSQRGDHPRHSRWRSMACSGCYTIFTGEQGRVIPVWDETAGMFTAGFRCDACWAAALAEVRQQVARADESMRAKFCEFLQLWGSCEAAAEIRQQPLAEARNAMQRILDLIASEEGRYFGKVPR